MAAGAAILLLLACLVGGGVAAHLKVASSSEAPEALVQDLQLLRDDVSQARSSWSNLATVVKPRIEALEQVSGELRGMLHSVLALRRPHIVEHCGSFSSSCGECAAAPICGWCADSMSCIPGTRQGPAASYFCNAASYSHKVCLGMGCGVYTTCDGCIADALCGWLPQQAKCVSGSEFGPSGDEVGGSFATSGMSKPDSWVHQNSLDGYRLDASRCTT